MDAMKKRTRSSVSIWNGPCAAVRCTSVGHALNRVGLSVCAKENTQIIVRNGRTSIAQQPTDGLLWAAGTRACDSESRSANRSIVFSKQRKAGRQLRVAELASFELVWAAVPLINKIIQDDVKKITFIHVHTHDTTLA
jgi:hypothetical protein